MRYAAAVLALSLFVAGCKGADGATGPQGPAGATGLQGPQGVAGTSNMVTFTGIMSTASVDLPLPASATANNLPVFTCYIGTATTGPWIVVPFSFVTGAPFCGVGVRADGIVYIGLRQWLLGERYYVTAAWK